MPALPLNLYTAAQVRALDRYAIEKLGVPGYTLMCRAGAAALTVLMQRWPLARHIRVLCGSGSNGGDGYVLARLAKAAELDVEVYALADPRKLKGDARLAYDECQVAGVSIQPYEQQNLASADVLVDAVFGTGLDRPLDAGTIGQIGRINASGRPVLALDLPSGLHADTGAVMGAAVRATETISFIGLKIGCFAGEGPDYRGQLHFDALEVRSIPPELAQPAAERLEVSLLSKRLQPRWRSAHKGDFGRVLIVGGGAGMPGAVRLCGEACLRSGAGLVTVATRREHVAAVVAARPELICHGVDDASELRALIEAADILVIGPGLGRDAWAHALFDAVMASDKPAVIDADGLNILAERGGAQRSDRWILTPHPGEAARLLATDTGAVQRDRLGALHGLIDRFGGVVILKGAGSLVGRPGTVPALCDRGNPGMASAGMGDVLTGTVAALLAQLHDPWDAARLGVLVHALAGDAAAHAGQRGLIASDVIVQLPACLNPRSS